MDGNPASYQPPEKRKVQPQTDKTPKRPSRTLKLAYIPSNSHTATSLNMSGSPTSTRRRATLTAHQAWRHATGSFFPPEPHVHEEWTYRGEETIPEAGSPESSATSTGTSSPNLNNISASDSLSETYTMSSTPYTTPSFGCRPRSGSMGVHYSTAHRRVPSSPSFRSTLTLVPHGYFDRPPSPSSSISSRSSEPVISASLSLSELLASTTTISLGDPPAEDVDELARREVQREERKQAMRERHAAIRERRERERWVKSQTRC